MPPLCVTGVPTERRSWGFWVRAGGYPAAVLQAGINEDFRRLALAGAGDLDQAFDGQVLQATLDKADVVPVKIAEFGELFLRYAHDITTLADGVADPASVGRYFLLRNHIGSTP